MEQAATVLRTMANATRLRIVLRLLEGEAAVADLERELGVRQPNLSQQLGELRDAGLVVGRRDSRSVIYSLAGERQQRLAAALAHVFGAEGDAPQAPPVPRRSLRRAHLGAVFATLDMA